MNSRYIIIIILFCLTSCDNANNGEKFTLDIDKLDRIMEYSEYLFSMEKIRSSEILDSIHSYSDKIIQDTIPNTRLPKANLYISTSTNTYFKVYENPAGTIVAIGLYINQNVYNVAEYFNNGQVKCKFNVTDEGKRDGPYQCFNEDGTSRLKGYYKNDNQIKDSLYHFE